MKSPSAPNHGSAARSFHFKSTTCLRSREQNRLRRLLFEQFEDRRLLALAVDDDYTTIQNQLLVITPDGTWSNDTIRQWGCVDEIPEYWDGSWGYGEWEGNWVYGYWDVINNYHEEGVPEEYHPAECVENGWVSMSPDNATGGIETWPQGSLTELVQGARAFTYTPPQNFIGTDTFTYWIDDELEADYATVTIIVRAPNVAPQTNNDSGYSTNEDTPLGGSSVLPNDTDANGDDLTAVLVANATRGYVSLNADGTFTYAPYQNEHGSDSFRYQAYDGFAYGNVATVSIQVDPVNDPPVAVNNSYIFVQDIPRLINFLADDSDPDSSALIPINVSATTLHGGSLIQYLDGTFAYAPPSGYVGPDSFTYQASDGQNSSNVATVTILVKADGPELLAEIMPGTNGSGAFEKAMMGGALYFNAASPSGGYELWKTDGTAEGTVLVKDIFPGSGDSVPWRLTNVNGTLYFNAVDSVHGRELWKSDGTEGGTVLVKDIHEGPAGSDPLAPTFHNVNGALLIFADDGVHGLELWKSDGTETGTVLVKDILPGSASGFVYILDGTAVIGNMLYFATMNGTSAQLWKSDGTESGTVLVKDFGSNSGIDWLTNLNGTLIFSTTSPLTGGKLWKSNGTTTGTTPLHEFHFMYYSYNPFTETDFGSARSLTVVNNKVYFHATNATNSGLWVTDGISTSFVHSVGIADGTGWNGVSAAIGNTLYFKGGNSQGGLWRSDGTASGTYKVKDVVPDHMAVANGKLYFQGNDGVSGYEPWVSDGTSSGTRLLRDLEPGNSIYSGVLDLINFNGSLVFSAFNTAAGWEPWILRPVNHPPAGTDKTIGITQNATYTLSAANFGFTDPNDSPPHALAAVKIARLPTLGTLTNNGSTFAVGQTISIAAINAGQLRYAPPPGQTGNNLASFEFQVQDNGGTANYGGDLDVWPNTITFNVSPATTDLALTAFTTFGTGLRISYTITGTVVTDFAIELYASPDGSTLEQQLQAVTPPTDYKTAGLHTINFAPTFTDPASDYYLVAVLDPSGVVGETNEANNAAPFSGGAFVVHEAGGRDVVHISGGAAADTIAATTVNGTTLQITIGGQATDYALASVNHIHFRGHDGNDSFTADPLLGLQIWGYGGSGDDSLWGGALGDTLTGGDGHDQIFGGAGIDWLIGLAGNDTLDGGGDSDLLDGGDGADSLTGGSGNDDLLGGAGDDSVTGGEGNDSLSGDGGNDFLDGEEGNDDLDGGGGDDVALGGLGADHIDGGAGNDLLIGDEDDGSISGGDGDDDFYGGNSSNISGGGGHNSYDGFYEEDVPASIELTLDPPDDGNEGIGISITGHISPPGKYMLDGMVTSDYQSFPVETDGDGNFILSVIYSDDGSSPGNGTLSDDYTIDVEVWLMGHPELSDSASTEVTVHNLDPILDVWLENGEVHGIVSEYHGNIPDADIVSVTIDWGDGTDPEIIAGLLAEDPNEDYFFEEWFGSSAHTYADPSQTYTITVTAEDDDGGTTTETIAPPPSGVTLRIFNGGKNGKEVTEKLTVGAFTVANLNNTDGDDTIDSEDDVVLASQTGVDEVDLMKLIVVRPADYAPNTSVTLTGSSGVRFWEKATKETAIPMVGGSASISFADGQSQRTIWVEATEISAAVRDIHIVATYNNATDEVRATAVWAEIHDAEFGQVDAAEILAVPDFSYLPMGSNVRVLLDQYGGTGLRDDPDDWGFANHEVQSWLLLPAGIANEPDVQFDVTRRKDVLRKTVQGNTTIFTQIFVYPTKLDEANDDTWGPGPDGDEDGPIQGLMFSADAPGYSPRTSNPATNIALRFNFEEFVRVRFDGTAPSGDTLDGSRASGKGLWQSLMHVEKVGGTWGRASTYNQIGVGNGIAPLP